MRAPGSHSAESSSADQALSRALERERAEQPEVRYEVAPEKGRAAPWSRRIATGAVLIAVLLAPTGFVPAVSALLEKNSPVGEALVSVLAALIGVALGAAAALNIERGLRPMPADRRSHRGTIRKRRVIALVFKRLIDIAVSSFALIILAPALLAIAVALKLEEPKASVILSQTRIGRDGVPFRLLKFRTFRTSADGSLQLGSVGHFIRVTALDELPQFLNVLKGEMSLVGPRPIRPVEPIQTAWWSSHSFAPGLTGPAQIGDIELSVQDREKLDMWYEENWSPTLDIRIVVRTLTALFRT